MRTSFRKIIITLVLITMSLIVSAYCSKTSNMANVKEKLYTSTTVDDAYIQTPYESLDKIPKDYGYELAVKNGDVVGRWGKSHNVEKLNNFIKAYENKTLKNGDMVRITIYSIEGTPLIKDLIFTEKGLKLIVDPTRDSSFKKIEEFMITSIFTETKDQHITYNAKTTTNIIKYLISIDITQ